MILLPSNREQMVNIHTKKNKLNKKNVHKHENVLVLKSSNKVDLKSIRKGRTI